MSVRVAVGTPSLLDGLGVVPQPSRLTDCFGYVYRIDHLPTGQSYIGKHVHVAGENFEEYRGSGSEWVEFKRGRPWSEFSKSLLSFAASPEELALAEKEAILLAWLHGDKLLNKLIPIEPEMLARLYVDGRLFVADLERLGKGSVMCAVRNGRTFYRAEFEFCRGDGTRLKIAGQGITPEAAREQREIKLRRWLEMKSAPTLF